MKSTTKFKTMDGCLLLMLHLFLLMILLLSSSHQVFSQDVEEGGAGGGEEEDAVDVDMDGNTARWLAELEEAHRSTSAVKSVSLDTFFAYGQRVRVCYY